MADKYLGSQERNRSLRDDRVIHWLEIIKRGEWKLTESCIVFDTEGRLINGQHRLTAIYLGGVTCDAAVMRNVPAETQDVMDSGLNRRTNDALAMRGEKNAFALAAGLRWEHRLRYIEARDGADEAVHYAGGSRPTTPHLIAIFDENPELWREMAKLSQGVARATNMRNGVACGVFYRLFTIDADDAANFHEKLVTGAGLEEGDPILQLRSVLAPQRRLRGEKMPDYREVAVTYKAWNLWRDGDRRGNLTWHFGGAHREAFPVPR
jgi:hypothetical protein